jgi:RING finger family protein
MARCSICYTLVKAGDAIHACPECRQEYHESCWSELGGCGTYGCAAAAVAEKPALPVLVGAGWGDSKTCPACRSPIGASLLVCSCGARFPYADPMTPEEFGAFTGGQRSIATSKRALVVLFLLSIVGVTAPLAGPAAGLYAYRKRAQLAGAHGTFLALGVGSAALGSVYLVILLLLALGK